MTGMVNLAAHIVLTFGLSRGLGDGVGVGVGEGIDGSAIGIEGKREG